MCRVTGLRRGSCRRCYRRSGLKFEVVNCFDKFSQSCAVPPNGLNMQTYSATSFTGFLPKQTACQNSCGIDYCEVLCSFDRFPSTNNIVDLAFGPLTPDCKYSSTGSLMDLSGG